MDFYCDHCKQTFENAWTDEDALKEKDILFPAENIKNMSLVCDVCFKMIMDFNEPSLKRYDSVV